MSAASKEIPAFLLAGGRPRDEAGTVRMLSRAFAGIHKPSVAYVGTANGDSPVFFEGMKELLCKAGADRVVFVHLAEEGADADKAKEALASADIIFLAGGEVEDGMNWLKKHNLLDFLRELYAEGKQFVGVSAGSIMLGKYWVRWEDEDDDETAELFGCLGIIPATFDTHGEEEDWKELKAALKLMGGGARGYGIPHGGLISADSRGELTNLEKALLVFTNEHGQIQQL